MWILLTVLICKASIEPCWDDSRQIDFPFLGVTKVLS
jgi:hypothetical protein